MKGGGSLRVPALEVSMDPRNRRKSIAGINLVFGKGFVVVIIIVIVVIIIVVVVVIVVVVCCESLLMVFFLSIFLTSFPSFPSPHRSKTEREPEREQTKTVNPLLSERFTSTSSSSSPSPPHSVQTPGRIEKTTVYRGSPEGIFWVGGKGSGGKGEREFAGSPLKDGGRKRKKTKRTLIARYFFFVFVFVFVFVVVVVVFFIDLFSFKRDDF